MRDVNDSLGSVPKPGGWLHLDVSKGVSGPMIAGALLHLGLDERVVREALDEAQLHRVGMRVTPLVREGMKGVQVEITDDAGRPLVQEAPHRALHRAGARVATARRRHQAPHVDVRPEPEPKAMGIAKGDDSANEGAQDDDGARVLPIGGQQSQALSDDEAHEAHDAREERRPRGRAALSAAEEWLSGKETNAAAVIAFVTGGGLSPVTKALAAQVLRRALSARAVVEGTAPEDSSPLAALKLEGAEAIVLVAEAVMCAALLAALSPARISASVVLLDQEADASIEACLEGARVREEDVGFAPTTLLGAALVRSLAHRFGPRGDVVLGRAGSGFGHALSRGRRHVTRALYGEDVRIPTREGSEDSGELARIEAVLELRDRGGLLQLLQAAGAFGITTEAVLDKDGAARSRLCCAAPAEATPEVSRVLLGAGRAQEVLLSTVERRRPERREVTVSVGRGNRKELVRVSELNERGHVLAVEPSQVDLDEAASRLGVPASTLEREALRAYEAQRVVDAPASGLGQGEPEDR